MPADNRMGTAPPADVILPTAGSPPRTTAARSPRPSPSRTAGSSPWAATTTCSRSGASTTQVIDVGGPHGHPRA